MARQLDVLDDSWRGGLVWSSSYEFHSPEFGVFCLLASVASGIDK